MASLETRLEEFKEFTRNKEGGDIWFFDDLDEMVKIIEEKDKEIERLNNLIEEKNQEIKELEYAYITK